MKGGDWMEEDGVARLGFSPSPGSQQGSESYQDICTGSFISICMDCSCCQLGVGGLAEETLAVHQGCGISCWQNRM